MEMSGHGELLPGVGFAIFSGLFTVPSTLGWLVVLQLAASPGHLKGIIGRARGLFETKVFAHCADIVGLRKLGNQVLVNRLSCIQTPRQVVRNGQLDLSNHRALTWYVLELEA